MINYKERNYVCLLDLGMDLIRGKWKAVILCHLIDGPKRFLALQRLTGNVSHKVLNDTLKQLEDDGLISKKVYPEVPPRVEYFLTPLGEELSAVIKQFETWSVKHFSYLNVDSK